MSNRNRISHNIQLTSEEKSLCDASPSEVILYHITRNPRYLIFVTTAFGGICLLRYIYR